MTVGFDLTGKAANAGETAGFGRSTVADGSVLDINISFQFRDKAWTETVVSGWRISQRRRPWLSVVETSKKRTDALSEPPKETSTHRDGASR